MNRFNDKKWFKMEVPYFPRYAYAKKLSLFEEQASISASTLPAMERLSDYLSDGRVKSAEQLPPIAIPYSQPERLKPSHSPPHTAEIAPRTIK